LEGFHCIKSIECFCFVFSFKSPSESIRTIGLSIIKESLQHAIGLPESEEGAKTYMTLTALKQTTKVPWSGLLSSALCDMVEKGLVQDVSSLPDYFLS